MLKLQGGSLDPFASGVLVLGVERGCKALSAFLATRKEYRVVVRLGRSTDSGDLTGQTVAESPVPNLTREKVQIAVAALVGKQLQEPPMYSAKKKNGVRLHTLARQGVQVERAPVPIEVYKATLRGYVERGSDVEVDLEVSKGTYVRTLAEKLGTSLGLPAHAFSLSRTRVGPYTINEAVPSELLTNTNALLAALAKDTVLARIAGIKI